LFQSLFVRLHGSRLTLGLSLLNFLRIGYDFILGSGKFTLELLLAFLGGFQLQNQFGERI
jgi:hypothetical protein